MSLLATVRSFLTQRAIEFAPTDYPDMLKLGFSGRSGFFLCYICVNEKERMILVRTLAPLKAPQEKKLATAELFAWVNPNIVVACLQIDLFTGLMASETSLVLGQSDCDLDTFTRLLNLSWVTMDQWFHAVRAVITGGLSPKQAMDETERRRQSGGPDGTRRHEPSDGRLADMLWGSMN
jgi:hypothetical protein